jgi:hypothetical protein
MRPSRGQSDGQQGATIRLFSPKRNNSTAPIQGTSAVKPERGCIRIAEYAQNIFRAQQNLCITYPLENTFASQPCIAPGKSPICKASDRAPEMSCR